MFLLVIVIPGWCFYLSCYGAQVWTAVSVTSYWWHHNAETPAWRVWGVPRENSSYPGFRVGSSARTHTHTHTGSHSLAQLSLTLRCLWPCVFMVGLFCVGVQTSRWHFSLTPCHPKKNGRFLPQSRILSSPKSQRYSLNLLISLTEYCREQSAVIMASFVGLF